MTSHDHLVDRFIEEVAEGRMPHEGSEERIAYEEECRAEAAEWSATGRRVRELFA